MENTLIILLSDHFASLNESVQKEVYREFYNLLYGRTYCMVKDHAATEDIIQDSFIKILKKPPKYDDMTKLKAWIKLVAKNTAYNYIRKNKKIVTNST